MFDIWIGEVNLTTLVLIFSVFILLPWQLLLCFKVKRIVLRLLPSIVLFAATAIFFAFIYIADGWDSIGYLFFALYTGFMLLVCGIAWLVSTIVRIVARARRKRTECN
jgi:hypothetical protein